MHLPTVSACRRSMELSDPRFRAHNVPYDFEQPENISEWFSLTAAPNTKLARRAPGDDQTNAPMILTKVESSFIVAEVTVSADFEMDWDQGGLIIFAGGLPGRSVSNTIIRQRPGIVMPASMMQQRSKWAKVGLEFTGGELGVSTVVANPECGADWSFTPAFPSLTPREAFSINMPSLRVKLERVGMDLWVWYRVPDDAPTVLTARTPEMLSRNWKKCREISGFFDTRTIKGGVWVGCYASRPVDLEDACEEDGLLVEYEDLEIL